MKDLAHIMTWISEDAAAVPSMGDRQMLLDYLARYNIPAEGHFRKALQDDDGWEWRYPAYIVKRFASDQSLEPKLREKLRLLCSKRGGGKNLQLKQKLLDKILPGALTWTGRGPYWKVQSNWVKRIIIVEPMGCFVIDLTPESEVVAAHEV